MPPITLFGISIAFSFVAWGLFAAYAIWPELRVRSRVDALRPLLILHSFRFVGLSFLALLSLASLRNSLGIPLVWIFNVWGSVDLLDAFYQANAGGLLPGQLGAAYFIPTVIVPFLLITHALMFRLLLKRDPVAATAPIQI